MKRVLHRAVSCLLLLTILAGFGICVALACSVPARSRAPVILRLP